MATLNDRFNRFSQGLTEKYEPYVRQHLAKVYTVLCAATAATTVGAVLQCGQILDLGFFATLASLILVLSLHFYRDDGKNYYTRLGMLLSFGFCSGQSLGPLLSYVSMVNPSIIITALAGTTITFLSLTFASLLAERGKYLFLGGILVSVINTMAIFSLLNIFFQSFFVQMIQLYVGVFVMAAFIVFDTQNIIEKCRHGNRDVVQHALDLFFDVLSMFRRLLIILTQKEQRNRDERQKKRN